MKHLHVQWCTCNLTSERERERERERETDFMCFIYQLRFVRIKLNTSVSSQVRLHLLQCRALINCWLPAASVKITFILLLCFYIILSNMNTSHMYVLGLSLSVCVCVCMFASHHATQHQTAAVNPGFSTQLPSSLSGTRKYKIYASDTHQNLSCTVDVYI